MYVSDCCGTTLMSFETPICSNCREHCDCQEDNSTTHYPHHNGKEYVYPLKHKELTVKELSELIEELHPYPIEEDE